MRWGLVLLAARLWAQVAMPAAAVSPSVAAPCISGPKITPQTFVNLERRFTDQLASFEYPIDILGAARAVYLRDYGLTITAEVSLIVTPALMPFRTEISKADIEKIHARKLAQLPLLKKAMKDMAHAAALNLAGILGGPEYERSGLQVALAVRLVYLPYEDKSGLPGQIIMHANLKNAAAGQLQEEQQ
jgi:hypothetical protein